MSGFTETNCHAKVYTCSGRCAEHAHHAQVLKSLEQYIHINFMVYSRFGIWHRQWFDWIVFLDSIGVEPLEGRRCALTQCRLLKLKPPALLPTATGKIYYPISIRILFSSAELPPLAMFLLRQTRSCRGLPGAGRTAAHVRRLVGALRCPCDCSRHSHKPTACRRAQRGRHIPHTTWTVAGQFRGTWHF